MSILSALEKFGSEVKGWFSEHAVNIAQAIGEAQIAVNIASSVATAAGAPVSVAHELGKVSGGLGLLDSTVTSEASAGTLTAAAGAVTNLATGILGDIGVKNAQLTAAVNTVASKVNAVATVLQSAATTAATSPA